MNSLVLLSLAMSRRCQPTAEENALLAITLADALLALQILQPDKVVDPLQAYQMFKPANELRVQAEVGRWGKCGTRVNTISPGVVITPLPND